MDLSDKGGECDREDLDGAGRGAWYWGLAGGGGDLLPIEDEADGDRSFCIVLRGPLSVGKSCGRLNYPNFSDQNDH